MNKKKIYIAIPLVITALILLIAATDLHAANNYTLTVSQNTYVTMGDASGIIPVTITNDLASTDYIGYVKISFDASIYYVGLDTAAPVGWQVIGVTNGLGQAYAEMQVINPADPAYRIDPGESLTFYIVVTGPKSGNTYLPILSGASDITDYVLNKCKTPSKATEVWKAKNDTKFTQLGTCDPANRCGAGYVQDCFQRKALYSAITASPSSVGAGGIITVIQTITNRSTATQNSVRPAIDNMVVGNGIIRTDTADASRVTGPSPASQPLASGVSQTYQWTYTASGSGNLQFCNSATNDTGAATSAQSCSNNVAIGNFTATLSLTPTQIVSGQTVTVKLIVTNNGSTTLYNITPTLTPPAGVGSTKISGPTPPNLGNLAPGESDIFQWEYQITGNVNDTFTFSGYAKDKDGLRTIPDPAVSNQGRISTYSVTVSPNTKCSGSINVPFTFRVNNSGAYNIQQVQIYTPTQTPLFPNPTSASPATPCSSIPTVNSPSAGVTTYTSITGFPSGEYCDFTVTYPSVPSVTENSDYSFTVKIWDTQTPTNKDPRASIGAIVKITKYCINMVAIPDTLEPNCTATIIATITPAPSDGTSVTFSATAGTLYDITKTTGGEAQAIYKAPPDDPPLLPSVTVTSSFQDMTGSVTVNLILDNPATPQCSPNSYFKRILWREIVQ